MVELLRSPRAGRVSSAGGFTLVEVLVSMTILAVGLMVLGGMLLQASQKSEAAAAVSYQTAILAAEAARYDAIPFDQLVAGTVCDTVTTAPLARVRCATITNISPKVRQVSVVVTATDVPGVPPSSVTIERSISGNGTPLNNP